MEETFDAKSEVAVSDGAHHPLKAFVVSGLMVGVLDGLAATINSAINGGSPLRVFQYIASGVLGSSSFQGGWPTFLLGVFLHFVIAFGASAAFIAVGRFVPALLRVPFYLTGPVYGVAVYFFMRDLIIPLSSVTRLNYTGRASAIGIIIHILFVGIPIVLIAQKFAKPQKSDLE